MLKGQEQMFPISVATIIFIFALSVALGYTYYESLTITTTLQTSQEILNEVDAAHIAGYCLEKKGLLDEAELKNIKNSIKELCNIDADVFIRDIDSGESWSLGSSQPNGRLVNINIKSGNEIHMGELYAEV
jgi:hypothetical protein